MSSDFYTFEILEAGVGDIAIAPNQALIFILDTNSKNNDKKMKLMAEIQCWALWDMTNHNNIDPATLSLSEQLIADLNKWSDQFDQLYNLKDPEFDYSAPLFKSKEDKNRFYDAGWSLFNRLKIEVPEIEWWYRDMRHSKLMQEPLTI